MLLYIVLQIHVNLWKIYISLHILKLFRFSCFQLIDAMLGLFKKNIFIFHKFHFFLMKNVGPTMPIIYS